MVPRLRLNYRLSRIKTWNMDKALTRGGITDIPRFMGLRVEDITENILCHGLRCLGGGDKISNAVLDGFSLLLLGDVGPIELKIMDQGFPIWPLIRNAIDIKLATAGVSK